MELAKINSFLNCKKFAVAGVSLDNKKTGNAIYRELKKQSFQVVPLNPNIDTIDGDKCYPQIAELPNDVDALIIVTKPEISDVLIKDAIERGIKHIFCQLGSVNNESIDYANSLNINIIHHECLFMFANPHGMHKFHGFCAKLFRTYPN